MALTRLSRHELAVLQRFNQLQRGRSPWASLGRALRSGLGNYAVNTPLFLLPRRVNLQPKHRVLEIGCSRGANLRFLATRFRFREPPVGLDLSVRALRAARERDGGSSDLVAGTGSRLPFADGSFDLIVAAHMLRHLSDEGMMRLLVEAQRVLRPGGLLAVWEYTSADSGQRNRFNGWLLDRLGGSGELRDFQTLAHWASEARYDVVENANLRPFIFPPIPRVSLLARKPPADSAATT